VAGLSHADAAVAADWQPRAGEQWARGRRAPCFPAVRGTWLTSKDTGVHLRPCTIIADGEVAEPDCEEPMLRL